MRAINVALTAICIILFFVDAPGEQHRPREITFEQIKPYVASLVYADSATGELRMSNPMMLKVQQRLARRSLTDTKLLTITWLAYMAVMEKSDGTTVDSMNTDNIPGWCYTWTAAYVQATDELEGVLATVEDNRDYFDLLDIHISQILSRDTGFLAPLLQELSTLLDRAGTSVTCTDCRVEFFQWLEDLSGRP